MNKNSAFNILLVIAIVTTGISVFYNLLLRQSFPVSVRYDFPSVHRAGEEAPAQAPSADTSGVWEEPAEQDEFLEYETEYEAIDVVFYEGDAADMSDEGITSVQFPLDINAATVEELKFIPGVGDVTAQRIVQYREHLGGYKSLEQLMEIKGIAEKTYELIAPYLYIE